MKKNIILLAIIATLLIIGVGLLIAAKNEIDSQNTQIVALQKIINEDDSLNKNYSAWIENHKTPKDNPYYIPPKKSTAPALPTITQ